MRIRTLAIGAIAALAVVSALTLAAPALAKSPKFTISQVGHGTWSANDPGVSVTGTTSGDPFTADTTAYFEPVDGVMPPWPGCVPGKGTLTTSSGSSTLTLTLRGDLCRAVAPTGYLIFKGWHDVSGALPYCKKKEVTGRGSFDIRVMTDGSGTWLLDGELACDAR